MIIDAHNHPDWWGHNRVKQLENMDRFHIDKAWVLSLDMPRDELATADPRAMDVDTCQSPYGAIPFKKCLAYAEADPDRFILGFCPDPRRPEARDRLEVAAEMYGVRVCGECKFRMMYDDFDALDLFRLAGRLGLPVTLHLQTPIEAGVKYPRPHDWYGGDMDTLERVLQKCPDTTFLGHALAFWAGISADSLGEHQSYPEGPVVPGGRLPQLLRRYPNLYCDMSANSGYTALNRDHGHAKEFLDEFQDRVLYARDLFGNQHQQLLESLALPQAVLDKLYYQNAEKLIAATAP